MDNIIYHQNHSSQNSFPTKYQAGIINPLTRISYKQIININTRFRNNYTITPSSDFGFNYSGIEQMLNDHLKIKANYHWPLFTIYSLFKWNESRKK